MHELSQGLKCSLQTSTRVRLLLHLLAGYSQVLPPDSY